MVQGQPGQNSPQDPISKITKAKWTGGVTQAVESLLCKCKALSSNPILTKKKKKFSYTYSQKESSGVV
jgi:hypothetical protein